MPSGTDFLTPAWRRRLLRGAAIVGIAAGAWLFGAAAASASAPDLQTPLGATVEAATDGVRDTSDSVGDVRARVSDHVGDVTEPVIRTVSDVTTPIAAQVAEPVRPIAESVADVVDPVVEGLAPVEQAVVAATGPVTDMVNLDPVEPVIGTVGGVVGQVAQAVEPATGALQPVLDAVDPVTAATQPVVDAVQPVIDAANPVVDVIEPAVPVIEPAVPEPAVPVIEVVAPVVPDIEVLAPVVPDRTGPPAQDLGASSSAPNPQAADGKSTANVGSETETATSSEPDTFQFAALTVEGRTALGDNVIAATAAGPNDVTWPALSPADPGPGSDPVDPARPTGPPVAGGAVGCGTNAGGGAGPGGGGNPAAALVDVVAGPDAECGTVHAQNASALPDRSDEPGASPD